LISTSTDRTGLVWNVGFDAPRRPVASSTAALRDRWNDLTTLDGEVSLRAMSELFANPASSVALLKENLKPGAAPSKANLDKLVVAVGSATFSEREAATEEFDQLGAAAAPFVRQSFSKVQSPEGRQRLARFLIRHDQLGRLTGSRLRERRSVELLELIGSPAAHELLRQLADGGITPLAQDCANALKRLDSRQN
jgi:hypothetical protein